MCPNDISPCTCTPLPAAKETSRFDDPKVYIRTTSVPAPAHLIHVQSIGARETSMLDMDELSGMGAELDVLYKSICRRRLPLEAEVHALLTFIIPRVGQNHTCTVYVRYFWQGNYQIYGHVRCVYTMLANPNHSYKSWTTLYTNTVCRLNNWRCSWQSMPNL